jgi:PAS domain S-box-containing protein
MRLYGFRYLTFSLIKANKVQHLLLKSFLPIVIFIIILQGFLDNVWSFNHINPPLTGALILLIVIALTTVIVYRVSAIIGAQLLKAENQLKESEEKFRSTMEHSADAIFITDQFGKYIYANKTASGMLGYTFEELTSKTFSDISPPDKKSEYYEIFKQILAGQGIFTEIELLKKDGEFISTDLNAVLLPDGTIYGSCRDITQRKSDEKKVRVLNRKLSELNADKDRFIAILGHDLKSPFNNLLGLSDILIENLSTLKKKEIEDLASSINSTARKTYGLLDDILMWARIQQGKMPFSPQELDLRVICNQVLEIMGMAVDNKRISVEYTWKDDIMVFADAQMLKTILRNLISNAIKFTNQQGTIRISATRTGAKTEITVSDNGVGIDTENLSKLFDITEVLTTNGTDGESGTGLGLLLCKEFVEKHGGQIWVESLVGEGSQFHVII